MHLGHFSKLYIHTLLKKYSDCRSIKQMNSIPMKIDLDLLADMCDFDEPELLRLKVADFLVSIDNEPKGRELTGT